MTAAPRPRYTIVMSHSLSYPSEKRRSLDNIAEIAEQIATHGYALCHQLPCISGCQLLDFTSRIGSHDLGIDEELSGPPIMHLRFDAAKAARRDRPAYFSNEAFPLHTDLAYVVNPPRYLFTLCVQPDPQGGGVTLLSDCSHAWQDLPPEHKRQLEKPQFKFRNPPNTPPGATEPLPIYLAAEGESIFRYRRDSMSFPSQADAAIAYFSQAVENVAFSFPLRRGDLLIVDNHRILHGRTAFVPPENSNAHRHLLRTYAQDARRSAFLTRANKPINIA